MPYPTLAWLACMSLAFGVEAHAGPSQAAPNRPNFVFFMTDDQRADALSIAGNPLLKTPNIDRLAREGVWLRNAFVTNSLCTPSRACYLTGLYGHSTGVIDNGANNALTSKFRTFAEILRDHGYEVAFIGKSHIRGNLRDRPWDYYFGFKGQGQYLNPSIAENGGPDLPRTGYVDDILTDKALEFLARPHERPFCLFLWFKAPHRSWVRPPRLAQLYEGLTVPEPNTFRTGYAGKPRAVADADMRIGSFPDVKSLDQLVKDYDATVAAVDENVGRVTDVLERRGLTRNTAVVYASDNGFFLGEWNFFDKRLMYEPSIRVPLVIRYPARFPAGKVCQQMVLNLDVAPTLLELAGVEIPSMMQGKSLVPLCEGRQVPWRDAWYYEYYEYPQPHRVRPHRGVRTDRWKLIRYETVPPEWELYDLATDPDETTNLYGKVDQAATVRSLTLRMEQLRRETNDPDVNKP